MDAGVGAEDVGRSDSFVGPVAPAVTAGVFLRGVATNAAVPTLPRSHLLALPAVDGIGFRPTPLLAAALLAACLLLVNVTLIIHD